MRDHADACGRLPAVGKDSGSHARSTNWPSYPGRSDRRGALPGSWGCAVRKHRRFCSTVWHSEMRRAPWPFSPRDGQPEGGGPVVMGSPRNGRWLRAALRAAGTSRGGESEYWKFLNRGKRHAGRLGEAVKAGVRDVERWDVRTGSCTAGLYVPTSSQDTPYLRDRVIVPTISCICARHGASA